jgi:hypothetical protein
MGRRGANHTAIFFAAMGTLGCGLARNMESLILARFVRFLFILLVSHPYTSQIAGIGGGGLFTTSS